METSLHRELKRLYAGEGEQTEVRCGPYRIDAMAGDELVEIQHGSLAAIRDKIGRLLARHRVRVVKPIVVNKLLVKRASRGGEVVDRRRSSKRGSLLDLFDELVYFTKVYPHPRLTLEVLLVDVEEWRYPGHGRRRRYRRRDHQMEDLRLVEVLGVHRMSTGADLRNLVACPLPKPFDTGHLAEGLGIRRWVAQRIAYCFREMGIARQVGKRRNSIIYEFVPEKRRRRAA